MKKNNSQSAKPNSSPKKSRTVFIQPTSLVLATYILLLLSKIIDLTLINRENEYYSVVILQMMVFLLPGAIWCKFSGEKYVKNLRLRLFGANSIVLILASSLLMISGSLLLGFLFGGLENLSQNFSLYDTFISRDNGTVPVRLYLLVAYAILPAICEEFVFRGILCHEYERGGVTRAIVLSSVFFALLHFNFANLPVYLFSGVILAMTLYATRSLFGAMLTHFLYNIFGLFGQPYMSTLYNITNSTKLFTFIVGFVFIASAAIFCGEASRLYKNHLYRGHSSEYRQPVNDELPKIRDSYIDVIKAPSAIACLAVYIIALIISWF